MRQESELCMKKSVTGSILVAGGMISTAILFAAGISAGITNDGNFSTLWIINQFGLIPVLVIYFTVAVIGAIITLIAIFDNGEDYEEGNSSTSSK